MIVYVATTNAGKLRELKELTAGSDLHLVSDDLYEEVDEGENSYAENAALKARVFRQILLEHGIKACVIADDSGLEVAALGGRPGVLSARYGGEHISWEARRTLLRESVRPFADHSARYVCALHFIDEHGKEIATHGMVEGKIAMDERGEGGFSYDPLFLYPPLERTFAELRVREKNAVSHRARAIGELLRSLDGIEERETVAEKA